MNSFKMAAMAMAVGMTQAFAQNTSVTVPADTAFRVVDSGPSHRVWQRETYELSPDGNVVSRVHKFTELASGLNYLDSNGLWVESQEKIEAFANGAVARQGQHTVIFASNLNTEGAIDMQCADGKRLRSNILGLMYVDTATGKAIVIGELQDSEGELVGDNQVLYPNAFDGVKADVLFTYRRDGIEQDVILREKLPDPESFNMVSASTELEVFTEFIDPPTASVTDSTAAQGQETDQSVKWGVTSLGHGKAFSLDGQDAPATVFKRYTTVNGRHFLLEKTRYQDIQVPLSKLPEQASNARGVRGLASLNPVLPKAPVRKTAARPVKLAMGQMPAKGYVLDYNTLTTSYTNYTFQGDTTYYISGALILAGTNIFEPNTVIKYASGASISGVAGSVLNFISAPYRPVIFTAKDDNVTGEPISGSTGSPSGYYANPALNLASMSTVTLGNFRILYANRAISAGSASPVIYNAQLVKCGVAVSDVNGTALLENVLFSNNKTNFNATSSANTIVAENATFNNSFDLINGSFANTSICLTNCALVNITNLSGSIAASYNGFYGTPSVGSAAVTAAVNPLQTVGAASCYLTNGCAFLGAGTTNVDAYDLIETKTTYAPIVFTSTTLTTVTNFSPQAQRDNSGSPNLGYHYDPLDYVFGNTAAKSNVTFTAGTAAGWFYTASGATYGLIMGDSATASFKGTVSAPCYWAKYNTVQEGGNGNWTPQSYRGGMMGQSYSGTVPRMQALFTVCSVPCMEAGPYASSGPLFRIEANNSEFYSIGGCNYYCSINATNCLYMNCAPGLYDNYSAGNISMVGCTCLRGNIEADNTSGGTWPVAIYNCAFDSTTFYMNAHGGTTNGYYTDYNSFLVNSNRTLYAGAHDLTVTNSYNWQTSWLGRFYLPTNSALVNAGSTTANLLGLYHFTTQTNQVPETNSIVDIGYHYVATDSSGNPLDTDGDGTPDYLEDANGNGIYDTGDLSDWLVSPYNGVSNINRLNVYTPLK